MNPELLSNILGLNTSRKCACGLSQLSLTENICVKAIDERIRELSNYHIVYPGLDFPKVGCLHLLCRPFHGTGDVNEGAKVIYVVLPRFLIRKRQVFHEEY